MWKERKACWFGLLAANGPLSAKETSTSRLRFGIMSQAPKSFGISISGEVYRTLAISRSTISRAALAGLSRPLLIFAESLSFGEAYIHSTVSLDTHLAVV